MRNYSECDIKKNGERGIPRFPFSLFIFYVFQSH